LTALWSRCRGTGTPTRPEQPRKPGTTWRAAARRPSPHSFDRRGSLFALAGTCNPGSKHPRTLSHLPAHVMQIEKAKHSSDWGFVT
jgi:hypothetical protein